MTNTIKKTLILSSIGIGLIAIVTPLSVIAYRLEKKDNQKKDDDVRGAWVHIHDFDGESWGFSDHYWMNTAYLYNLSIYDSSNPTYYSIKGDYRAGQYNYDDWSVRYDNKDMRDKQFNSILIAMYNSNL